MDEKFNNNKIVKYLLSEYFDNDRKALAKATHKSESAVESWFRSKPKPVSNETLELLLYKLNSENVKISIPEEFQF